MNRIYFLNRGYAFKGLLAVRTETVSKVPGVVKICSGFIFR